MADAKNVSRPDISDVGSKSYEERHIPTDNGAIYARYYQGDGPALVLMHGFPDNLGIYDDLIPYLIGAGRRVVTFDFLGFGRSEKSATTTYSFAQQLNDLEAVVTHLGLDQVILTPHDSSGIVAVNFALTHPTETVGICMLNSAFDATPLVSWPEMIVLFADPQLSALAAQFAADPQQFKWLLEWQQGRFAESLAPAQRDHFHAFIGPLIADNFMRQPSAAKAFVQMTADFFAELARNSARLNEVAALDMPVKVIWGTADRYLTTAMGQERASRFKQGSFHPVAAGHWLQSDEPALVAKEILS